MNLDDFNRDFDSAERSIQRTAIAVIVISIVWLLFLMGGIGTGLFLLGRWLGVW